jgi:AcrR family transcriptional regulator
MDGRIERGERTRKAVAEHAAALASVDGLAGMTLAQVAGSLGLSKSSVQAAYRTKEELQVAAVAAASEIFSTSVVVPALGFPEGLPRLEALVDNWLAYVEQRVFPGGCFMGATLAEYDSHPGTVRDTLARARRQWLRLLEHQITIAQTNGDVAASPSAALLAFEIDALLAAANVARNLTDDSSPLTMARALITLHLHGR